MINEKKMKLNIKLRKRNKTNNENEYSSRSFSRPSNKRTESTPNIPNNITLNENSPRFNESNFLNSRNIQEIRIDLKNIPKGNIKNYKLHKKNKISYPQSQNNSLSFGNKMNNSFSQESINSPHTYRTNTNFSESISNYHNNTFTQPTNRAYEVKYGKNKKNKIIFNNNYKEKENDSMEIPYYRPKGYRKRNDDNNNSFWKQLDNNDYFSYNNSFINRTNNDEDLKLNNTINYNHDKIIKRKNSLILINNIPKPNKFKKKIPPIPRKSNVSSNNNSFYFDETNNITNGNSNNINNQNIRYYDMKTDNNSDLYKYKKKIFNRKNIKDYNNFNKNQIYINKTHNPRYLQDIEKIGIKLSFNKKRKNDSIDLISPELFNDLKSYSYERPKKEIFFSDLDINKINDYNNYCNYNNYMQYNYLLNNNMENYDKMRKNILKD
jgi:hypothetical protein